MTISNGDFAFTKTFSYNYRPYLRSGRLHTDQLMILRADCFYRSKSGCKFNGNYDIEVNVDVIGKSYCNYLGFRWDECGEPKDYFTIEMGTQYIDSLSSIKLGLSEKKVIENLRIEVEHLIAQYIEQYNDEHYMRGKNSAQIRGCELEILNPYRTDVMLLSEHMASIKIKDFENYTLAECNFSSISQQIKEYNDMVEMRKNKEKNAAKKSAVLIEREILQKESTEARNHRTSLSTFDQFNRGL